MFANWISTQRKNKAINFAYPTRSKDFNFNIYRRLARL